jgi:hypothetical protein
MSLLGISGGSTPRGEERTLLLDVEQASVREDYRAAPEQETSPRMSTSEKMWQLFLQSGCQQYLPSFF